jgi:hypothetical protein
MVLVLNTLRLQNIELSGVEGEYQMAALPGFEPGSDG